jgi:hypothetical protein
VANPDISLTRAELLGLVAELRRQLRDDLSWHAQLPADLRDLVYRTAAVVMGGTGLPIEEVLVAVVEQAAEQARSIGVEGLSRELRRALNRSKRGTRFYTS